MEHPSATVLLARLHAKARIRHLQLLVRLAELGNLKRAAEAIHLSQPAVTQLLADLERLVDVPLFDRHSRGVRITPAGAALVPVARRMLDALADASEVLEAMKRRSAGVVRVAAITGVNSGWLVRALPAFAREEPAIQIHVQECEADRCMELVSRREVDVALCREPVALPTGCSFHPQLPDHFVVACGVHHPLARRKRVGWASLARESWLLPPVQTAARRLFDERMRELGASPPTSPVVTRVPALTWAMLQSERLLTLVPFGVVWQLVDAQQLALVDVSPAMGFGPLGWVVQSEGVSAATERFLRHLEKDARRKP